MLLEVEQLSGFKPPSRAHTERMCPNAEDPKWFRTKWMLNDREKNNSLFIYSPAVMCTDIYRRHLSQKCVDRSSLDQPVFVPFNLTVYPEWSFQSICPYKIDTCTNIKISTHTPVPNSPCVSKPSLRWISLKCESVRPWIELTCRCVTLSVRVCVDLYKGRNQGTPNKHSQTPQLFCSRHPPSSVFILSLFLSLYPLFMHALWSWMQMLSAGRETERMRARERERERAGLWLRRKGRVLCSALGGCLPVETQWMWYERQLGQQWCE